MRYRVLGPLEVDPLVQHPALRRAKPRALLALLLLHANEVVSTDLLLDALWGGSPPPRALGSLQNYVSHLRKALGEEALVTRAPGYLLRVEPEELDLAVFERLVAETRGAEASVRAERLRSALALWRGPALADFAYEQFAQSEIARLEELRLSALSARIDADLELGRHGELVGELEAVVAQHPLLQRLRGQLMLALYRSGRHAEALEAYRDGRRVLREELGLDPSDDLRKLERAILEQDASLAGEPAATSIAEPAPTVRKVVTVLFADVVGHTRLASTVDPESLRNVMRRFFSSMRTVIERHGGTPEKFAGDEVMAVFGVPLAHEDDALRAVRAADEMRAALAALSDELERDHGVRLELRTGVNTGEVVAGDPGEVPLVTGDAVNVAKRLQEAAQPGELVFGPMTLALVRDAVEIEELGPLVLRNRPEPLPAFRVVRVLEDAPGVARRLDAPLVGRRQELRRIRAAYVRARDKHRCLLALVVGDAGIGKTRLARELTAGLGREADVLVGRCSSYGEGATYLPFVDVVRQATRGETLEELLADDEDADAIARGIRALTSPDGSALPAGEATWAVGRFLRSLARRRPLVLVLEDLHWSEPTLLDLLEQVVERTEGVPLLVLTTARRELLERRPQWVDAYVSVQLEPLGDEDAATLIEKLAEDELDPDVRARITEAAEGNPLFAEQLLAFVLERGPGALDALPPTIEALLASRLDTLNPTERAMVERASIVGRDFQQSEVVAISPPEDAGTVASALNALMRRGFVRRRRATAAADDAFAFNHILIRDGAYAAVPKERRAELHEAFADWLAQRGDALDEIVGYHLEQAHGYLVALRPATRHAFQVAAEAGERLGRAGVLALRRGDISATTNLLGRATALLPETQERRSELMVELGLAHRLGGDLERGAQTFAAAMTAAASEGHQRVLARSKLELANLGVFRGADPDELLGVATSVLPTFEVFDDARSLGRAWLTIAFVRGGFFCENAAQEEAAERALRQYRRAGWPTFGCVGELAAALYHGPRHVDEALARAVELLENEASDRLGETHVLMFVSGLEALQGRFSHARRLNREARARLEELGAAAAAAAGCDAIAADIEVLAGDLETAEQILRTSCEEFEERGESALLSTRAAKLAEVLYALDNDDDALHWTQVAEHNAAARDVSAQFSWRAARAQVLARHGTMAEADEYARRALELVEATDALTQQGDVLLAVSEVELLNGNSEGAARYLEEAVKRYRRKGNVVSARHAEDLLRDRLLV